MKQNVLRFLTPAGIAGLLLCLSLPLCAQPDPIKFGKVEMAELDLKSYAPDTSAAAVVLGDYGKSYFRYDLHGFKMIHERLVRIKILKKSGYHWATAKIPFYRSGSNSQENVVKLHGYTYNKENGKLVKEKLTQEAVFEEQKTPHWNVKRFTMPNVREGSVIEYEFTIESDFFLNMREWEFQQAIPVAWSEYRVAIPNYFHYRLLSQGYEPFHTNERSRSHMNIILRTSGYSRTPTMQSISAPTTTYRWAAKDVPALRDEPYVATMRDYVTKIEFELASIQFPGQTEQEITSDWRVVTENLLEMESFGRQLSKTGFAKEIIAAAKAKAADPAGQIAMLHDFVRKSMKWNNHESMYASESLKQRFENHTGNSADINLMLVALLREVDLDANPLILSTRSHGRVMSEYTLVSKFNYVVAHVNLGGKDVLLDATDPFVCPNMLPIRCLNGMGRLISKQTGRWVTLDTPEKLSTMTMMRLKPDKDGQWKGTVNISSSGYSALASRKEILENGVNKYEESLRKAKPDWQLEKLAVKNVEKSGEALEVTCEVTMPEAVLTTGNLMYIKPLLTESQQENPFRNDSRKFPVDFTLPTEQVVVGSYTVPDGYVVEEMPKNVIVDLPGKGGRFTFVAARNGNVIQVTSKISLRKSLYLPEEYPHLKEFYHQIVSKHAEQIVLKKQ